MANSLRTPNHLSAEFQTGKWSPEEVTRLNSIVQDMNERGWRPETTTARSSGLKFQGSWAIHGMQSNAVISGTKSLNVLLLLTDNCTLILKCRVAKSSSLA